MVKRDYMSMIYKALLAAVLAAVCFFAFPSAAQAFDAGSLYENKTAQSGDPVYYTDAESGSCWVVADGKWHECIADSSSYEKTAEAVRQQMYNRVKECTVYIAVTKQGNTASVNDVFDAVDSKIYKDDGKPYGGDYLEFMSTVSLNGTGSELLDASSQSQDYDFYRLTVNIESLTTKQEEDKITEFLEYFNEAYIVGNEVIQNAADGDRQYYIVKTIYNYLAKNTVYDMDTYKGNVSKDSEQYRYSHTAYGALFGNTEGAYNPETFDAVNTINLDYQQDSQGLFRVYKRNQGRSVCDGYSLVFYYLCKLNGIDCRIVKGDYTEGSASDPHAWNTVYLKDYNDPDYAWYSVDVTFGCQKSKKISDIFSIIDYSYFLRGTENESFSPAEHQQMYSEYSSLKQSSTDYEFEISSIKEENLYTIVTRRRDADADKEYVDTGEYNLENYLIISPDGKFYKADADNDYNFIACDGFTFYSSGYYYSCDFYDFAKGIEYTCDDKYMRDAGDYEFDIVTVGDNIVYKKTVTVAPLYMGDWSNYSQDLTKYSDKADFIGADILISADIYDNTETKLISGSDYDMICYVSGDESKSSINPHNVGSYVIELIYKGNYCGSIELPFEVLKADLSQLKTASPISFTYGENIEASCAKLKIGDTEIYNGTDYKAEVSGGLNYGDSGTITLTGLAGSSVIQEGTVAQQSYVIDKRYDISYLYDGKYISNTKYQYTGKEIKPTDFTLGYTVSSTGQKVTLVKGTDYVIKSYSDNINAGTGKINIELIGNYTGTATLKFYIENGKLSITCSDMTYNGKSQSANPVVKLGDAVLKKGTDYKVSGSAKDPGLYTGTVTGIGSFSNISGKFVYFIKPGALSGVKTSTAYNSITVSWTKQGSNCTYEVLVYDSSAKAWKTVGQTTGSSYKITSVYSNGKKTSVKANTQYKIRVRGVIKGTVNGKSVTKYGAVTELTERTNPSQLSGVKASTSQSSVKVSWTKQSGCKYEVWVYDTGSKGWKKIASTENSSYKITSVYVSGKKTSVKANTQYKIRVRAVFSGKVNGKSVTKYGPVKEMTVRTNPKTLSCKASRSSSTAIRMTWNKDTSVSGYQVQCSTSSNFKSGVTTVTINKNSNYAYTFKNLKKGKTYYLRIRSFKKVGNTTYYSAYSSSVKVKL